MDGEVSPTDCNGDHASSNGSKAAGNQEITTINGTHTKDGGAQATGNGDVALAANKPIDELSAASNPEPTVRKSAPRELSLVDEIMSAMSDKGLGEGRDTGASRTSVSATPTPTSPKPKYTRSVSENFSNLPTVAGKPKATSPPPAPKPKVKAHSMKLPSPQSMKLPSPKGTALHSLCGRPALGYQAAAPLSATDK